MSQVILDFGSGNTCQNDKEIVKEMYDELKKVDSGKHKIIVKWQLFKEAGQNIPLEKDVFFFAHQYGNKLGYPVTASVFDSRSLELLLQFNKLPFIKIANNRKLDRLIGDIPRKIPVYVSVGNRKDFGTMAGITYLCCVSKYPALKEDYSAMFESQHLTKAISDHTDGFQLYRKHKPAIVEWHYKLPDSTGLDAGIFAHTPAQLREIL